MKQFRLFFGVSLLAALPLVTFVRDAIADADGDPEPADGADEIPDATPVAELSKRRRQVLAKLTTDETVLINVTTRDMPSSPDILNLGRKAGKALARCVADNVDDKQRFRCAAMLGVIGDKSSLPALRGALEAWSPAVRRAAIVALTAMPDPASVEPLIKLLQREDETAPNRAAILRALGAMSDTRALPALRAHLLHPKPLEEGLKVDAFDALMRSRHLMAKGTLLADVSHALKSGDNVLVASATNAAALLRAPELVSALIPLMDSADSHIRNRAVYALGKIGDKVATKALIAHIPKVREARMLNNIAFALERLDPKAFYATIPQLADHKQAAIRMNAAFVLGDVKRTEGVAMLKKALEDKNDFVKVSAVAALGKIDAPDAIPSLERFVADKSPTLREEAIYSILAMSAGKRADLVYEKLFTAPRTQFRAGLALAKLGDARVGPWVLATCVDRTSCTNAATSAYLRGSKDPFAPGRVLVSWTKGRNDLTDLVAQLKPAGAAPLALSEVQAAMAHDDYRRLGAATDLVGDLAAPSGKVVLDPLAKHENTRMRVHALVALSRFQKDGADPALFAEMDNLPQDHLPGFSRLVSRIAEPDVRKRLSGPLTDRAKGKDPALALAAANILLEWDPENGAFRFLEGLGSPSVLERDLAERYLRRNKRREVTFVLRRMFARESRDGVKERLRKILDGRADES